MLVARGFSLAVVLVTLVVTGAATNWWMGPVWADVRATEPAFQAQSWEAALGTGVTLGLLGGFRAITADFLWVETNSHWETEDLAATHKLIDLVTTVDPRPRYFWINGARMIAHDMPHWRVRAAGGAERLSSDALRRIDQEQAWAALALLERAREVHPRDPYYVLEMADIHWRRRGDLATAAEYYRLASSQPGAPYYAARIYAEFLKRQGKLREAYEWLRALHPTLPRDNPIANAEVVFHRIQELEEALQVSESERYEPVKP